MSTKANYGHAGPRQFAAYPPFWGSKMASKTTTGRQNNFGKSYAIMVVATPEDHHFRDDRRPDRQYATGWCLFVQRREAGHMGAASMGTALHLHCGQRRFVLGGRDRRVAAGTRLEARTRATACRWTSTLNVTRER
jgi:hypothetical protein